MSDIDFSRCHVIWVQTLPDMTKELYETKPKVYNFMKLIAEFMFLESTNDEGRLTPKIVEKWYKPTKKHTRVRLRSWNDDLDFCTEIRRMLSYIDEWDLNDLKGIKEYRTKMEAYIEKIEREGKE